MTFDAALEQAEQLSTAASTVGTATQPILLFYGLSQLGRAIAAVSPKIGNDEYRLSGHGIKDGDLQGVASQGLASLMVHGEPTGAFPVVAQALESSPMSEPVPLGTIWGLLPEAEKFRLSGGGGLQRLILVPEDSYIVGPRRRPVTDFTPSPSTCR
ncbi:YaaC family protein [Arthrobacter sp. MMS18-M83]|uniref:YaaC family protein n=1 Tax=Arthrobacter sp. MMS18-M83 TaxID=2996261 RepID=UPI003FA39B2F